MNFAPNPPRAAARIHRTVVARGRSLNPSVRLAFPFPPSSQHRFTWTHFVRKKSPLFSYSCKPLHPQPLSFYTHTNSRGWYGPARPKPSYSLALLLRSFLPESFLRGVHGRHTLLPCAAIHLPFFQAFAHSLQKHRGCTPERFPASRAPTRAYARHYSSAPT